MSSDHGSTVKNELASSEALTPLRFKVSVHDESFSSEELLINPEWFPGISAGAIVKLELCRDETGTSVGTTQTSNGLSTVTSVSTGSQGVSQSSVPNGSAINQSVSGGSPNGKCFQQNSIAASREHSKISIDTNLNSQSNASSTTAGIATSTTCSSTTKSLVLRVCLVSDTEGKSSKRVQISLLKRVAEAVGVAPWSSATVVQIDSSASAGAEFVEFSFKDQFISRADIWRFKSDVVGETTYIGKALNLGGMRATTREIRCADGTKIESSLLVEGTRFIFRSRSTRIFWLVQMSREMWEPTGDDASSLHVERLVDGFCAPLLKKWRELDVNHSLSIILFTRLECLGSGDILRYEDLYCVALENEQAARLTEIALVAALKRELIAFGRSLGDFTRKQARKYAERRKNAKQQPTTTTNLSSGSGGRNIINTRRRPRAASDEHSYSNDQQRQCGDEYTFEHDYLDPEPQPVSAADGNVLEAINLALNVLDKHYMDRDLQRTGNSIVLLSASNGLFTVDGRLAQITKQRMMDNGIGMDMVSLAVPPLHTAPIFMHRPPSTRAGNRSVAYEVPHWINLSFVDPERAAEPKAWIAAAAPRRARRGWRVSRLELDAPRSRRHDDDGTRRSFDSSHRAGISPPDYYMLGGSSLGAITNGRRRRLLQACAGGSIGTKNRQQRRIPEALAYLITDNSQKKKLRNNKIQNTDKMLPLPQQRSPVITSSAGLTFLGGLVHRPTSLPSPLPTQEIMIGTTSPATQNKSTDNAQRPRGGELLDAALRRFDATPRLIPEFCQNINDNNNQQSPGTHWQPSVLIGSLSSRETHEPLTTQWYDIDNAVAENATSSPSDVPGGKGTGFLATAAAAGITGRLPVGGSHHAFKHIAPPVVEESKFESLDDETGGSKNRSEGDIPNEDSSQLVSSVDSDFLSDDEADLPYRPPLKRPNWGTIAMASSPDMLARESRYGSVPSSDIKQDSQLPSTVLLSKEFEAHDKNAFVDHRPQLQLFEPRSEFIDTMIRRSSMTRASPPGSNIQPPPVIYGSSLGALPSPALGQLSNRAAVSSTTRLSSMGTNSNQTIRRISDLDRGSHKKFLGSGSGDTSKQASKRTYSLLHGQVAASTTSNKVPDLCGISASGGIEDSSGPLAFDTPKHRQFVNPFKREDEEEILRERSHNRRRWSHVFPQGEEEFRTNWSGHGVGPNWKSLTTPAVLPLETDYLSPEFGTRAFKESNHSVLVSEENKHIIFGLVAQRIGGDYQIVKIENKIQNDLSAGFKSSTTRIEDGSIPQGNTVATSDAAIANISSRFRALQNRQIPLLGGRKREISNGLTHLKLSGRPPQSRLGGPDTSHGAAPSSPPGYALYTLSMGHRIQTFTYDAAQAKINVRSFRSRYDNDDPDNRFEYQYRLWLSAHDGYDHGEGRLDVEREASTISAFEPIPRTRRKQGTYIRRMQTFLKFPSPETNWNMLDQVISGYMRPSDTLSSVKFRRILFVVIPPKITSEAEAADYNTRIHRFQQLLDSKRASSESAGTLDIETPRQDTESSFVSTNSTQSGEKRSRKKNDVFKKRHLQITLENSRWRDEWLALESDAFVDSKRCWRFSIHWLLCSGWVVEEFLTSLSRKAKQYKLQLCQVPEYSLQLDIHPFLAPATAVVASKPRLVALLKRALVKHMGFVFDSITAIKHVSQRPGISPPDIPIQQFIHRLGTAFVRVQSDGRFVWIRNRLKSPHASFRIRPLNPDAILVPLRCRAQTLDLILGYCLGPLFCKYLVSIIRYQQKRTGTSISAAERCRLEHAFIDAVDLIADYIEPPVDRDATSMQAIDDDSWASASTTAASRPIPQVSSRRSVSLKIPADHSTTPSRSSSQFVEDDYDDATTGSTVTFSGHNLSSPPQVSSRLSINAGGTNSVNSSQPAAPQSSVQQQSATASSAGLSSNSAMSLSSV